MTSPSKRARDIELLVLDVDGVLTDGGLYYGSNGERYKRFHVRDGAGIKALLSKGITVAVITGRTSGATTTRMSELGISHIYQGVEDKLSALRKLSDELGVPLSRTACVGDDLAELPLMTHVRLGVAVADAHAKLREAAHWSTDKPGGQGAVREVCDLILDATGSK